MKRTTGIVLKMNITEAQLHEREVALRATYNDEYQNIIQICSILSLRVNS